jgi:hypothetical protein
MMEAARTSETSVDIQLRTRQYIPEDSELHIRRRESLKSHKLYANSPVTVKVKVKKIANVLLLLYSLYFILPVVYMF